MPGKRKKTSYRQDRRFGIQAKKTHRYNVVPPRKRGGWRL